jgi:hypothetical protein
MKLIYSIYTILVLTRIDNLDIQACEFHCKKVQKSDSLTSHVGADRTS